jgi:hypothetical protein
MLATVWRAAGITGRHTEKWGLLPRSGPEEPERDFSRMCKRYCPYRFRTVESLFGTKSTAIRTEKHADYFGGNDKLSRGYMPGRPGILMVDRRPGDR